MFSERNAQIEKSECADNRLYSEPAICCRNRDVGICDEKKVLLDGLKQEDGIQQEMGHVFSLAEGWQQVDKEFQCHCNIENICKKEQIWPDSYSGYPYPQAFNVICPDNVGVAGEKGLVSTNVSVHTQEGNPTNLSDLSRKQMDSLALVLGNQQMGSVRENEDFQKVQYQDIVNLFNAKDIRGEGQTMSNQLGKGQKEKKDGLHSDQVDLGDLDGVVFGTDIENSLTGIDDEKMQMPSKSVVSRNKSFGRREREDFLPLLLLRNQVHIGDMKTTSMNKVRSATCTSSISAFPCQSDSSTMHVDEGITRSWEIALSPDEITDTRQGTLDIGQNQTCGDREGFLKSGNENAKDCNGTSDCTTLNPQETVATRHSEEVNSCLAGGTWCQVDEDISFKIKCGQFAQCHGVHFLNLNGYDFDSGDKDDVNNRSSLDMMEEEELLLKKFLKNNPSLLRDSRTLLDGKSRHANEYDDISNSYYECPSMTEDTDKGCRRQTYEEILPKQPIHFHQKHTPIPLNYLQQETDNKDVSNGKSDEVWNIDNENLFHQRPAVVWHNDSWKELSEEDIVKISSTEELNTGGLKNKFYKDPAIKCPAIYFQDIKDDEPGAAKAKGELSSQNHVEVELEKDATVLPKSRPEKAKGFLHRSESVNASSDNGQGCFQPPPVITWHKDLPEPQEKEMWLEVDEEIFFKVNNWSSGTQNWETHHSMESFCCDCVFDSSAESLCTATAPSNHRKLVKTDEWNLGDLIVTLNSIRNYLPSVTSSKESSSNIKHLFHEGAHSSQSNLYDNERNCPIWLAEFLDKNCHETTHNSVDKCVTSMTKYESDPSSGNAEAMKNREQLSDMNLDRSVPNRFPSFNNDPRWFAVDEEVSLKHNACSSTFPSSESSELPHISMTSFRNEPNAQTSLLCISSYDGNLKKTDTGLRSSSSGSLKYCCNFLTDKGESIIMQQQSHKSKGQGKGRGQGQNRQGPSQKSKVFEPYWSEDKVSHGIKTGQLIVGPIRINVKNYREAYVPQPDGLADVFIEDMEDRNRALNSDEVVVLPYSLEKWRVSVEEFEEHKAGMNNKPQPNQATAIQSSTVKDDDYDSDDSGPDVIIESDDSDECSVSGGKEGGGHQKASQQQGQGLHNSAHLETSLKQLSVSQDASQLNEKQMSTNQAPNQLQSSDFKSIKCLTVAQMRQKYSHDPVAMALFGPGLADVVTPVSVGTSVVARFLQVTGRVVFLYERKHSRAASGHIKHMTDRSKKLALFAPLDSRVPRIIIQMSDCPKDFVDRPDDFVSTLFIARITSWEDNSKMPKGNLARSIGEAGQIEPETEALLIELDVDDSSFDDKVLACLPQDLPWTIPQEEIASRKDLRSSCIFTIDPSTARDLDDAVSCEELGDGNYKVGVHIADVSYFVSEGTDLDKVASQRATSVYLVQKVVPMLPRLLCEELCSLNPDEDRLAFSVEWIINEEGEICEEWYGRTIIRSCVKLSYEHAQGFIEQPDKEWTQQELPPISKPFVSKDVVKRVLTLNKIAVALRKQRHDNGALRLDQVKLSYSLDKETGLPNGTFVYQQKDSNRLIEEFMLLANMAVAHRIKHCFPEIAILRRHPAPQNKPLQVLEELCESLGLEINTSTAGAVQESLRKYYAEDEFSLARVQVLVALISKPMQNARYFCTGTLPDEVMYHHYALNVPLYTHFTSPIRRYADVMVHRLLSAAQGYSSPPSASVPELQKRASHCNDKKFNAKIASDRSSDMYFALYVKEAGQMEGNGMVMAVLDKSFDVLILAYGVTKRVYLENLPLLNSSYAKRHKAPELTVVWAADEKCNHRTHHLITLFTMVECVIYANKEPLKWSCVIRRPKEEIKFMTES